MHGGFGERLVRRSSASARRASGDPPEGPASGLSKVSFRPAQPLGAVAWCHWAAVAGDGHGERGSGEQARGGEGRAHP